MVGQESREEHPLLHRDDDDDDDDDEYKNEYEY